MTRLFQAGVDRKLVKEYSGHRSDALDQYQITSDKQKQMISEVLACNVTKKCSESSIKDEQATPKVTKPADQNINSNCQVLCSCNKKQ